MELKLELEPVTTGRVKSILPLLTLLLLPLYLDYALTVKLTLNPHLRQGHRAKLSLLAYVAMLHYGYWY